MVKEGEPILFAVKPFAGIGNIEKLSEKISRALHSSRYHAVVHTIDGADDTKVLVGDFIRNGHNKVFAVGGNEAVNLVASCLVNADATLGIVPLGAGNGLAEHLRIPNDESRAVNLVRRQKVSMIDCGIANNETFCCGAGFGLSADVAVAINSSPKHYFGQMGLAVLNRFANVKAENYLINVGGQEVRKAAYSLSVSNASKLGRSIRFSPDADITDGFLDVTIIAPFPGFFKPGLALRLFNGKIGKSRYVEIFRVRKIQVEKIGESGNFHIDGKEMPETRRVNFDIKSLGIKVYVP